MTSANAFSLVDGFNEFSVKLTESINSNEPSAQNLVFSSYSLVIALLMTLAGSRNETKNELIKSLKIDNYLGKESDKDHDLDDFYQMVHTKLIDVYDFSPNNEMKNILVLANKVIVNNLQINDSYQSIIEKKFNTKIDSVTGGSFTDLIDSTNKDIAKLTNNKITNLLDESFQTSSLALVNVIYFNFDWLYKFNETNTESNYEFYLNPSKSHKTKVDMMNLNRQRLPYSYLESINSHLIKLPYQNKKYYFNIIFPVDETDFLLKEDKSSIINKMRYDDLKQALFQNDNNQLINLKMPKFVIKTKTEFSSLLQQIGIVKAFSKNEADFSGISNDLYIDKIIQHAFIEINEMGTEAAAATAIKIVKRSIENSIDIILNRPFVFLITDKSNGVILFNGIFKGSSSTMTENIKDEL